MKYPEFITKDKIIGVTAPSAGITDEKKVYRLDSSIKNLNNRGYKIIETDNVRKCEIGRSTTAAQRAKQLIDLYKNNDVDLIICATGGDFLMEILPYIDTDAIKSNLKWIQGYSDPTSLLYMITTKLDIATIYSDNFATFGMKKWHKSLEENFQILEGKEIVQKSYDKYEGTHLQYAVGDEEYILDKKVEYKIIGNEKNIKVKGRIIGGCLDVLDTIIGTAFDGGKEFIQKYKEDGIIWYFDNCELTSEQVIRALWKFEVMGYFKYTKAILFGRSMTNQSCYDVSFEEAIKTAISKLDIPVIYDIDIGHVAPQFTIINGAIAEFEYSKGKGSIKFILK